MNRTQRAIKKKLREYENGRSRFKRVFLNDSKAVPDSPVNSEEVKRLQKELKTARKDTRDYSRTKPHKEVWEV